MPSALINKGTKFPKLSSLIINVFHLFIKNINNIKYIFKNFTNLIFNKIKDRTIYNNN